MKVLRKKCLKCGKIGRFGGKDLAAVIKALETSGWYDMNADEGYCPACNEIINAQEAEGIFWLEGSVS